jgi:hypothetical protein
MIKRICVGLVLTFATAAIALSQQQLLISIQLDRLYPSTVTVHEIKVAAQTTAPLPEQLADYEVVVNGEVRAKIATAIRVADSTVVFLRVKNKDLKENDRVQVRTVGTARRTSNQVRVAAEAPNFWLILTPGFVQNEALTNGLRRPVGQLGVAFDEMTLTPDWLGARTYLRSDSTISTDAKDRRSNVNLGLGLERSLLRRWFVPVRAETRLIGDQVIDNLSSVSSAGVASLAPWGWSRKFLKNSILDSPISPDFGLDAQIERRFRQDAISRRSFLEKNAFRLFGHSRWAHIRLLPGSGAGDPVELEIAGSGWYLPHQHTGGASGLVLVSRVEGLFEASLLVPISKLSVTSSGVTTAQKGTKSALRVKYSHGANEANGFQHSSQLSFGVELTGTK